MSIVYKGFTINEAAEATWVAKEVQAWKDTLDTLVLGTCTALKSSTNGHRHKNLYDPTGAYLRASVGTDSVDILLPDGVTTAASVGNQQTGLYPGIGVPDGNYVYFDNTDKLLGYDSAADSTNLVMYNLDTGGGIHAEADTDVEIVAGGSVEITGTTSVDVTSPEVNVLADVVSFESQTYNGIGLSINNANSSNDVTLSLLSDGTGSFGLSTHDGNGHVILQSSAADGLTIGASDGKLSFYEATPVTCPVLATDSGAIVDDVIDALQALGLVKNS